MIKILFLHKQLECGGIEQALYDLIGLMDKQTFEITMLLQQENGIWEQKFSDAGIKVNHVYGCQRMSRNPFVKGINFLKRQRLNHSWKNNGKGALSVALPGKYDIIVAYGIGCFDEMCFYGNAKTVKYIHGDAGTNKPYRDYVERTTDTLKKFDRILCVSEAARCSFVEKTGICKGVETHYNPLDSAKIRKLACEKVSFPVDEPMICAIGRLSPEKAFDRLVRIHKNLLDKGIRHRLVLVGDGPEREKIEEVVRTTKTEASVIMVGYQENPYPYMKQSSFLVCSSYTEGLPVISMEALSLGIPIVSAVPSIGEIFGDKTCGIVTENDDDSLEAGIERMLTDAEFYGVAKEGAQKRSEFFDGSRMVREIEDVFLDLVKQPKFD